MKIHDYINEDVQKILKTEIDGVRGAEVFAIGKLTNKKVTSAIISGRGNYQEAPIVDHGMKRGMVVIHNHPSGNLHPSSADIHAASILEKKGIGFFIVNNHVDEIYVVVEPFSPAILEKEEIIPFFQPGGSLASFFPNYEFRREQLLMVESIIKAFNQEDHLLVEAATGTGKSWAYLLPSIFWAEKGEGPVIISTNTINLQQQLLAKDIPSLKKILPFSFKAVLMLGRRNYICQRQLHYWQKHLTLEGDELEKMEISRLMKWSFETKKGLKGELSPQIEEDVWERVSSEGDSCLNEHCSFHQKCFFHQNRQEAATANLIIVNHHLFFSDLSLRSTIKEERAFIIPETNYVIFDEAHNMEEVATNHLGLLVKKSLLNRVLDRLQGKKMNGLLFLIRNRLSTIFSQKGIEKEVQERLDSLYQISIHLKEEVHSFFQAAEFFFQEEGGGNSDALRLRPRFRQRESWKKLLTKWEGFYKDLQEFTKGLLKVRTSILDYRETGTGLEDVVELGSAIRRIEDFSYALEVILSFEEEEMVFWLEMGKDGLSFMAAPLEVGEKLQKDLFQTKSSVVLTSATLTVNSRFDYIRRTLGLCDSKEEEISLSSPFNYEDQSILLIPDYLPLPSEKNFVQAIASFMEPFIAKLQGRTLILFTSYHMLNSFYFAISPFLQKIGIRILSQGQLERKEMVETFLEKKKAVILGTSSFWEGVDIPGEALLCVVIVKLPFPVPTVPIVEARTEMLKEKGFNPFYSYSLPRAIIRFRQGFGRLIRSRKDEGAVLVLDKRILQKSYGRVFLASLPPGVPVITGDSGTIEERFYSFFGKGGE